MANYYLLGPGFRKRFQGN